MPRPYSVDLRERVVRSVEEGLSCRETAERFHVSVSFVIKLLQRWRQRETVEPAVVGGHKTSVLLAHADRVRALVAAEPEATIDDLRDRLSQDGVQASRSAVGRCLLQLGLTRKKRRHALKSKTGRTSPRHAPPGKQRRPSF